jgi:response regulator of citrate/malate metabolism
VLGTWNSALRVSLEKKPVLKGRIIIITGDVMGADIKEFLTKNNPSYLVKPFDINSIKKQIYVIVKAGQS